MSEKLSVRVLLSDDQEGLLSWAKQRLAAQVPDEMEREMKSWNARWRAEALEHYLKQGWSYGCFNDKQELTGFLLAQPILFARGLTQTLWVEHMEFANAESAQLLFDTAYRWSRDKHFQCLLVEPVPGLEFIVKDWPTARALGQPFIEIKSARF
jgi:hypothetical protein